MMLPSLTRALSTVTRRRGSSAAALALLDGVLLGIIIAVILFALYKAIFA